MFPYPIITSGLRLIRRQSILCRPGSFAQLYKGPIKRSMRHTTTHLICNGRILKTEWRRTDITCHAGEDVACWRNPWKGKRVQIMNRRTARCNRNGGTEPVDDSSEMTSSRYSHRSQFRGLVDGLDNSCVCRGCNGLGKGWGAVARDLYAMLVLSFILMG